MGEILALGHPCPAHRVPGHFLTGEAPPVSLIRIPPCGFDVKHQASNRLSVSNAVQLACTLHSNPQAPVHKSLEARDHIEDNPRIDRAFAVIDPLSGFLWIAPRLLKAISMPLSFWIAVITSAAILLLSLLRSVRLREIQVLNKLVGPNGLPWVIQFKGQRERNKRPVR